MMNSNKKLIIIGAGGHGKVVYDIAIKAGFSVLGFLDDSLETAGFSNIAHLGSIADISKYSETCVFVCAIGDNSVRQKICDSNIVEWTFVTHPSAQIGYEVNIGNGTTIAAGATINPSVNIGKHCIINTGAIVEHDCEINDYVHISPGAVICGSVSIGNKTWIGAGAVVKNGVSVCSDVVVGAGSLILNDIAEKGVYIGSPALKML